MAEVLNSRSLLEHTTPMMQQYLDIKDQYVDYILMYRLGDFYECFFEDAVSASKECELTLTARDCGNGKRAAMCGVPFHKADQYIGRLVDKGYKVAICEQIGDPKASEGLVKREVIRVVTPGTVTDTGHLTEGANNFLSAICYGSMGVGCAFIDVSTGEVYATYFDGKDTDSLLINEMSAYSPSEVIFNASENVAAKCVSFVKEKFGSMVSIGQKKLFDYNLAKEAVRSTFPEDYGKLSETELVMAVGALVEYIKQTQKTNVTFCRDLNVYARGQYLDLDINTRRNLELVEAMRTRDKKGSLLWTLDKTKTAMGARLLRSWVLKPLLDIVAIGRRQSAVRSFLNSSELTEDVGELLNNVLDIERLTAKTVYGTANAKDLRAIQQSIAVLPSIKAAILNNTDGYLNDIIKNLDTLEDISEIIDKAIVDNPPFTVREGGMIRQGFDTDVDYYRSIKENGSQIMRSIEEREKEVTGIRTLKVDYNKVFGYYIEVSKSFINDVPDRYVRKQTLTNCERYITQELKEMETAIFGADDKLVSLEFEIFSKIREFISENSARIRRSAALLSQIDVFRSLAVVARKHNYVCPEVDNSTEIYIKDGRHPVVERFASDTYFVPNDTTLNTEKDRVMIITGPNMAGKSTYMRQVAIISVMAQIGSFVPAREARLGIVDKVFTRVGASDDLASGQSTFMLEMSEVASILKNATKKSLIIYDEVGRGTSTYDGMSIARAVVEYTRSKIGAKTLFATHYHELISMEDEFDGIVNYNIAAKKRGDSITFLRKIVRGGTDDSYGIEVAKLAGVPSEVVKRAREILADIESNDVKTVVINKDSAPQGFDLFSGIQSSKEDEAIKMLKETDLNTMTPIECMTLLFNVKNKLSD